jgi:hypothetical protein
MIRKVEARETKADIGKMDETAFQVTMLSIAAVCVAGAIFVAVKRRK